MPARSQNADTPANASQLTAVALGVWGASSVWISLGTLAVTNDSAMSRIAAFPPIWWLAALAVTGAAVAVATRLSLAQAWPLSVSALLWLPYLPGPVPASFLVWQGPLEGLVWVAIGVALSATLPLARLGRPVTRAVCDPRTAPWVAGGVLVVAALAALGSARPMLPTGDEPHYLVIAQSLLLDGDLRIENNHTRGDYLSYFSGRLRPDFMTRGADAQIYSIHAPGLAALVLPAFALAGYPGAVATVVLLAALTSALTWHVAWLLSTSVAGAWVGWAAVFLSSPFLFHSFTLYPDGPAALLVIVAVWLLVRLDAGQAVARTPLWIAGAALAALPWLHTRFAIIAAAAGACLAARLAGRGNGWRSLTAFLSVPAVAAVAWFGYFWMIWNTPNPAAPYGADPGAALAYIGRGLTGLLVDQQFGLLPSAPIYACAIAGLVVLARTRRRLAGELVLITVPYVTATAAYAMWWGGISSPARFLVALTPLAALLLAAGWPRQSAVSRTLTLLLLLISVAAVWPRAFVDGGRLLYSDRTGFDLTLGWAAQAIDLPLAFPSVHRDGSGGALRDAAAWLGAGFLVIMMAHRVAARLAPAARWTVVLWSAAIGLMGAATVVWTRHGGRVVTPERSKIAALQSVSRGGQTLFVGVAPYRRLAADEFLAQAAFATTDRLPPRAGDSTLLRAAGVPAGDYKLLISGATAGEATLVLGRNDGPLERWLLDGPTATPVADTLRLPVDIVSLSIRGDGRTDPAAVRLRLRPLALAGPVNTGGRRAVRAARYGRARAFAFDERVYLEPTGFWTRADGVASLVIDTDAPEEASGRPLIVRAGAVATSVELTVGAWTTRLALAAGQQEMVQLPPLNGHRAWALTIRSGPGFRPSAVDPASDDVRQLAVWVELP